MSQTYDALLVVSFGGPEGPDDVMPFLENVLRGKNVPRERMLAVAEHYQHFGGHSPINDQNRALIAALEAELAAEEPALPVFWGNRNWHPLLPDTLAEMGRRGVRRALALFTSAYSSYSGCRQYRENIADAQKQVGAAAPEIHKLRAFFNHPRFIAAQVDRVRTAWQQIPQPRRAATQLIFTAHSIPRAMADGCDYAAQLNETGRLIAKRLAEEGPSRPTWNLAYQSRSGPPSQPWLEPDIGDRLQQAQAAGARDVVVAPIGFLSDHMEVLYDLDTEAKELAGQLGLNLVRAGTVGTHPEMIAMIRELIVERMTPGSPRPALGTLGPRVDECPAGCCPAGMRPGPAPPR
ncbi:MAG TPA: ferrochelatase [Pirellulales bacterium]|jgi:ferrochelatase|nr:ferrochelatase [Pirellulales bacterium]